MSRHPSDDELIEHALGTGSREPATEGALDALIAASPELQLEVLAIREALGLVGASLGVSNRAAGRETLLAALDSSARFSPFIDDLARHFALPRTRVQQLLAATETPEAWVVTPRPGYRYMEFDTGAGAIASHAGFAELPRGMPIRYHRHMGPELNYVMEGALRTRDGRLISPGETLLMEPGSAHELTVDERADAFVAIVHEAFEIIEKP
jgi:anti-sigma factor ChrR (cupin superfamily)